MVHGDLKKNDQLFPKTNELIDRFGEDQMCTPLENSGTVVLSIIRNGGHTVDGALKNTVRIMMTLNYRRLYTDRIMMTLNYRRLYTDRPDPIVFMSCKGPLQGLQVSWSWSMITYHTHTSTHASLNTTNI